MKILQNILSIVKSIVISIAKFQSIAKSFAKFRAAEFF